MKPLFLSIKDLLPEFSKWFPKIDENKEKWRNLIEEYEERLCNNNV
jgi:hypothetical protein